MAYTDEDKRIALLTYESCKKNASQAAITCREFYGIDVSRFEITRWANGDCIDPRVSEKAQEDKRALSDKCEDFAERCMESMMGTIEGASLAQKATAFGIAVDKMLLLRGEPNAISQQKLSDDEINLELVRIRARLAERTGETIDTEFTTDIGGGE